MSDHDALCAYTLGAPVAEHLLAQMLRDLGADPDEGVPA